MAGERFSHLFLPGPSDKREDYSNPRRGGDGPRLRPQDRPTHADLIKRRLETAWQTAVARQAVAHADRHGVYLEFSSEPGFDLVLKSLEALSSDIRLLNVKREETEGTVTTRATVFVPQAKSGHFLRKVVAYATEDNRPKADGTTTPKHADLINSIGDIRAALVESFWMDARDRLPGDTPEWVEVWLSSEDLGVIESFTALCRTKNIRLGEGRLTFPERTVMLVLANRAQVGELIEHSDHIAEFRAAREVASFFIEQENKDQVAWVTDLLDRSRIEDVDRVVVLILDHGVNNGHRLLEPVLGDDDRHSVNPAWGPQDDHGHGTLMAGTVAYGDLLAALDGNDAIVLRHGLESAKILPPPPEQNPKRLWGHYTSQGVSLAEIQAPARTRIVCMAITSEDEPTRGRPTSWSGQIDEMASGYADDIRRLVILSAGNVNDPSEWKAYPESNKVCEVHDPAHAWNALTVGAFTAKTRITDSTLTGYRPLAAAGELSPFSSTSLTWQDHKWPIKPEVLFEGGNVAGGPNDSVLDIDDLKLVSTYHNPQVAQFSGFSATSAACAQAAWMAARIQAAYPQAWPETVRALMVHSADWTEEMKRQFLVDNSKSAHYQLMKICGYGVPSLERAMACAANSLSLIAEAAIQPFGKHATESRYVCKDMHIYRLPWPVDVLRELGALAVQMRITLSYFIEPSPGEVGWKDRYRYASHGLRFELNGPGEREEDFIARINRKAREDDAHPGTEGARDHWTIGEARNVGSIHSDIWSGTAAELALSNIIAVHPSVGWWRERQHLNRYNRQTRYSLVVSFSLPGQEVDIYTPVAVRLGVPVNVEIEI